MADQCIGKLYLDISQVQKDIKEVNDWLGKIGANINLEDKLTKGVTTALNKLVAEAKKAGEEAQKAIQSAVSVDAKGGIESTIAKVTTTVNTYARELDNAGNATARLVSTVQSGFDAAGNKVKEFADSTGAITKRTEEVKNSIEEQIEAMWKLHDAEEQAYMKQGNAAVEAGLKREEAALRAAQAEDDRAAKEVATMEASISKAAEAAERKAAAEQAALEKSIAADAKAQEQKRQQQIDAEFAREESRQREAAAEEEMWRRELATMEDAIAKENAEIDQQVSKYQEAEEKKIQASIDAEFRREELRQKEAQAEEDLWRREVAEMEDALQQQFKTDKINEAKQAYSDLTDAIKNYNAAKAIGNTEVMQNAQATIDSIMQQIPAMREVVEESNLELDTKQQILNVLRQITTAEREHETSVKQTVQSHTDLDSAVNGLVMRYMSLLAVMRMVKEVLGNMVEYVKEYSDKMNEIQIITGKSNKEIGQLSDKYRQLAEDMSVSSLDMADAAIYFTRQGLEAGEIENRLKNVTMYAKTANVEFTEAAELMTAVINSMKLVEEEAEDGRNAAQRVADVFLAIGDNAATSGYEIGQAMQKAAASAGAFGVEFEWLAASIGAVSETTRQEARTIGTAFNTIIARLHQIKQSGYNSEDETKINDVAKALGKINVVLMDQSGEWRDYQDIMTDVASVWDTLDDKTRSYIATTMAGVKQQNVFLAWMNDMSKTIEEGGRTWELYEKAIDSAGTATEKYGVYMDSVTAAQNKLTVAQENFYSLLQSETLVGWYNMLANVVTGITNATKALSGFNLIIPVAISLIVALVLQFKNAAAAAATAGASTLTFSAILRTFALSHPIVMAIAALGTSFALLSAAFSGASDEANVAVDKFNEASEKLDTTVTKLNKLKSYHGELAETYEKLTDETEDNTGALKNNTELLEGLGSVSSSARETIQLLKEGVLDEKEAWELLNKEIEKNIEIENQRALYAAAEKYSEYKYKKDPKFYQDAAEAGVSTYSDLQKYINDNYELMQMLEHAFSPFGDVFTTDFNGAIMSAIQEAQKITDDPEVIKNIVANILWNEYGSGTKDEGELAGAMAEEALEVIDEAIQYVTYGMNEVETNTIRQMFIDEIFGEDGEIDADEYRDLGKRVALLMMDGFSDGIISAENMLTVIGTELFGEYFDMIFSEEQIRSVVNDKELVDSIAQAYSELLAAGFSETELQNIYKGIVDSEGNANLEEWAGAVEYAITSMTQKLRHHFGQGFGLIDFLDEEGNQDWDDWLSRLDISTLKLMDDMRIAGTSATEFLDAWISSGMDVDAFTAKIKEMSNAISDTSEVTYDAAAAIKEYAKDYKSLSSEISTISDIIKQIKEGEAFSMADFLSIAEAHPTILTMIRDVDSLNQALTEVKHQDIDSIIGGFRELITGDPSNQFSSSEVDLMIARVMYLTGAIDEMAESGYEASYNMEQAFNTLRKELREGIRADAGEDFLMFDGEDVLSKLSFSNLKLIRTLFDEEVTIVQINKAWEESNGRIDEFINNLNNLQAETEETTTETVDYEKEIKNTTAEWDTLNKAIEKLIKGEKISLNDIIDLTDAHPELAQLIGDTDALIEKLNELKDTNIQSMIQTISGKLMSDEDFAKSFSSDMGISLTPGTSTLQQMRDAAVATGDNQITSLIDTYVQSMAIAMISQSDKFADVGQEILNEWLDTLFSESNADSAIASTEWYIALIEKLTGAYNDAANAEESWLEVQMRQQELEASNAWAKSNGFVEQLGQLENGLAYQFGGTIEDAYDVWSHFDESLRKSMIDTYPGLGKAMLDVERVMNDSASSAEDYQKAADGLNAEIKKYQNLANAKYFTGTYSAIQKLEKGTISATGAYEEFNKELDRVVKAGEDITDVTKKIADGSEYSASDVSNLSKVLGISADTIIQDFPAAVDIFNQLTGSTGELKAAFDALNQAAFIKITGQSEADFSQLENGLHAVQASAQETIDLLVATGQWEVATTDLPQEGLMWDPLRKQWVRFTESAQATFLKPKNNNPYAKGYSKSAKTSSGSSGGKGGGGGGGGSNKNNGMTEVERMLDRMNQTYDIQESQQGYYQAQKKYYEQTGQLQGVIAYDKKEIDALKQQNESLESNIELIERYIDIKKKELDSLSITDKNYKEVADDLDKLQDAHQKYTKQVVENKTSILELTDAIKEQQKAIRSMEIKLRTTILKAIEDREKRNSDMLSAEIEMENTIFDLIKKRYEKERDEIISTTRIKIDALNEEKSLLEEQLSLRKSLAEKEDKAKKLAEYEAQYQRILADPTRRKEALEIETKINDLRKEIAWDTAEEEVKAQEEAIDQQIESLEDYVEYVENYYEDLFNHPQKLIEEMELILKQADESITNWLMENSSLFMASTSEMQTTMIKELKDVLTRSDEDIAAWLTKNSDTFANSTAEKQEEMIKEVKGYITDADQTIIEWLKANDETYAASSENTQKTMVSGWRSTLDQMRGVITTYWDEVESIIAQGDEYIINFLKENSRDYREAGKLQAEAYVDEWMEQLSKLRKAYEEVSATAAATYSVIEAADSSSSSKGGGGGGSGSGGGTTTTTTNSAFDIKPSVTAGLLGGLTNTAKKGFAKSTDPLKNVALKAYATGGVADHTGPAWLDEAERVLNPYQTQLFETMVNALDSISRIGVAGMPNYSNAAASGSSPVSVGDIIVNVENLDTDDDYEELADKVGAVLMDRIGRTAAIGGLRIRSI